MKTSQSHSIASILEPDTASPLRQAEASLVSPQLSARKLGQLGEQYVALWLESLGWQILDRNWSTRYGELDIVALDRRSCLAFVEVKTRRTRTFGQPEEAVTYSKQTKLKHAAVQWLIARNRTNRHCVTRFDVAAVSVSAGSSDNPRVSIKLIQGAF
ncbi:UPF0102 protein [Bombiscardovia apis]|uniref:UPF0102 protein KIMH_05350 n=1 Tax=Bombiscardovia apis TaxID=2932182 RepID=A0ABM8BBX5_9BIFI|nr:YraN family protein [Bombiscardovia apis]BDR54424.1 UPF0102 protein [Bombiscardovia apis]